MPRKKKIVSFVEYIQDDIKVEEAKPKIDYPDHGKTIDELVRINRQNGAPIYEGIQDLILEIIPDAISNNNIKFPVKSGDKLMSVKDIVIAMEVKHSFRSEELWTAFRKFGDRVGCSIFVQMAIIELENKE